jgi:hydrogenase maturation protease
VIGLGNPLSGDDGFGARVLEQLRPGVSAFPDQTTLSNAHTDLLNHIENFSGYDCVILVDAILDPDGKLGHPGHIALFNEEAFASWPETSPSVHQVSPLLAVKLFRLLHPEAKSQITLVGLLVDQISRTPRYATDDMIAEGAKSVLAIIGMDVSN